MVIVAPAAAVQSAAGFGYALLAAPLLVIAVGPALALPALWLTFLPATAVMAAHLKAEIRWVIAWRMSLAGLPAALIGGWALRGMPPPVLQAATGLSVLAFTLAPAPRRAVLLSQPATDILAGALAGLLGAATGTNGPPLVLALSRHGLSQTQTRATLAWVFTVLGLTTLTMLALTGRLPGTACALLPVSAPSLALGTIGGSLLARRLPGRATATATRLLLLASGLACLIKAITG